MLARIRSSKLFGMLLCGLAFGCATAPEAPPPNRVPQAVKHWAVYYNNVLPAEAFLPYDLVVFDDAVHPPLTPLQSPSRILLGYVSLGEAAPHRPFEVHNRVGLKLTENPFWKGNQIIDVSLPAWRKFLLEEHIPSILAQGFNGIMIDTIDSPLYLAWNKPDHYGELYVACVKLVKAIRKKYPQMVIMVNRGFEVGSKRSILPDIAREVDFVLAESTMAQQDHLTKKFTFHPPKMQHNSREILTAAQKVNPHLRILSLDYWDPKEVEGVKNLYRAQRQNGYIPQVSTVLLDTLYPEP